MIKQNEDENEDENERICINENCPFHDNKFIFNCSMEMDNGDPGIAWCEIYNKNNHSIDVCGLK